MSDRYPVGLRKKYAHQQEYIEWGKSANAHLLSVPKMSDSPSVTGQIQFNTMVELTKESG